MSLWNTNKAFRDDYEKRILPSLDSRQLSRDGRMRNPDEKPLVTEAAQPVTPTETDAAPKVNVKKPKEESKVPPENDTKLTQKEKKEVKSPPVAITMEHTGIKEEEKNDDKVSELEKLPKEMETPVKNEVDEAKLKEMKREEEIAKAKMAIERKKKLAEKAAAKAAIRAQKEAEKKLKVLIVVICLFCNCIFFFSFLYKCLITFSAYLIFCRKPLILAMTSYPSTFPSPRII